MIAILGCGRIGEALLGGLLGAGWKDIVVTSRTDSRTTELRERHGVEATSDNAAAVAQAAAAKSPLPDIEEEPGQGVYGVLDGLEIRLGRPSYCGADELANEILSRDPEASVVAFRHGETCHVFAVRQRLPRRSRSFIDMASLSKCFPAIASRP